MRYLRGSSHMSGDLMDVVLGHFTSLSLVVRGLLSVPEACYAFSRDSGSRRKPIPPRVRQEFKWMVGVLPLGSVRLDAPVDRVLTTSDASGEDGGYGYAVTEGTACLDRATECFRVNEEWRFRELLPHELVHKKEQSPSPVPHLGPLPVSGHDRRLYDEELARGVKGCAAEPFDLRTSLDDFIEAREEDDQKIDHYLGSAAKQPKSRRPRKPLNRGPRLPKESLVSRELVENVIWRTVVRGVYKFKEPIARLEARAVCLALRRRLRDPARFGHRVLHLADSMTFVLAHCKGRSSCMCLNAIPRRMAAISLATNITMHCRWLEGYRNPSDSPSRPFKDGRCVSSHG